MPKKGLVRQSNGFWPIDIQEYADRPFVRYLARDPSNEHVVLVGFARDEAAAMRLVDEQIELLTLASEPPDQPPPNALKH